MAISKKPKNINSSIITNVDNKAESFIAAAGKSSNTILKENKKPTLIRFDLSLLRKVNEAARHRGISRSAWIQYIISKAIDNGDI